jgi:hypothetical protein
MPLKPIDYSKGIQYKIVCRDSSITDCYNGSSCSLKDRKKSHKKSYTNPNDKGYNLKVYQFIREHGGWDNWVFIQLEEYSCKSKQELLARERHWFDLLKPTLNTISPTFDVEKMKKKINEYNANHIEEHKKYCAEYYVTNKATFLAKVKQYYEQNKVELLEKSKVKVTCECGCTIRNQDLPEHKKTNKHLNLMAQKQGLLTRKIEIFDTLKPTLNTNSPMNNPKQYMVEYYVANKAKILAKAKQQYEQNKVELLEKNKEEVTCECGCVSTTQHLSRHQRTQKHLNLLAQKQ